MKLITLGLALLTSFSLWVHSAEPTELREWKAASGHKLRAIALRVEGGNVFFKRENGKTLQVPLGKLIQEDQSFLTKHFEIAGEEKKPDEPVPEKGKPADDLNHPLGQSTEEISCSGGFSYFLYLPKSLKKGKKHPVLFLMNPSGGGKNTSNRYLLGAERNGWILATSKQSKNGFNESGNAIGAMMDHVQKTLPIDRKRIYVSGMSGGSRMAFWAAQNRKEVIGVIACGAGGELGNRKQIAYGLCGTNCYNRSGMANSFKKISHKGAILRYFPGRHTWANDELCEDAITHLNGVFLSKNRSKYPEDFAAYSQQLGLLVSQSAKDKPFRAFMWANFAKTYGIKNTQASEAYTSLSGDKLNQTYIKGLVDVRSFAEKTFGKSSGSVWKANPKIAAKCIREAAKYTGTPWEEILKKMSEDAEKF